MPLQELHIRLMTPRLAVGGAHAMLSQLEGDELLAPTHASEDERKRTPYAGELVREALTRGPVVLWRSKAPRYDEALFMRNRQAKDGLRIVYKDVERLPAAELFASATRLAVVAKPEWGFIHWCFRDEKDSEAYNFGMTKSGEDLDGFGLTNVFTRSWFGPYLVSLLGKELLLSFPYAVETGFGVQVDLSAEPWNPDYSSFDRQRAELVKRLAAAGVIGLFTKGPSLRWKPAPRWVSPAWQPRKRP